MATYEIDLSGDLVTVTSGGRFVEEGLGFEIKGANRVSYVDGQTIAVSGSGLRVRKHDHTVYIEANQTGGLF